MSKLIGCLSNSQQTDLHLACVTAQVAGMREEQRKWREMQDSNTTLQEEVASWKARFKAEAARSDELAADVSKLAAALSVSEAAAEELRQQQANMQPRVVGVLCSHVCLCVERRSFACACSA